MVKQASPFVTKRKKRQRKGCNSRCYVLSPWGKALACGNKHLVAKVQSGLDRNRQEAQRDSSLCAEMGEVIKIQ